MDVEFSAVPQAGNGTEQVSSDVASIAPGYTPGAVRGAAPYPEARAARRKAPMQILHRKDRDLANHNEMRQC